MSKELSVILLGVAVIVVAYSGFPAPWRMLLLLLIGLAIIIIGFLLRAPSSAAHAGKSSPYHPFVENLPAGQAGDTTHPAHDHTTHEHKEGITSLN
jgi:hypothetical protein